MSVLGKRQRDLTSSNSNQSPLTPQLEPPIKKQRPNYFAKWKIFFDDKEWSISVFKGTPVNDIQQTISLITGIEQFLCMNGDGDVLVLSSYLPDNTKVYIRSLRRYRTKHVQDDSENSDIDTEDDDDDNDHDSNDNDDDDNVDIKIEIPKKDRITLELAFVGSDCTPVFLGVKSCCSWGKIFQAFAKAKGQDVKDLRFIYEGSRIDPNWIVGQVIDKEELNENQPISINVLKSQSGS